MEYEKKRIETKKKVVESGKRFLPYELLVKLSKDQYRRKDENGKRIRRLNNKGEALSFFCSEYPEVKEAVSKWLLYCTNSLKHERSFLRELMREAFSERYTGVYIEVEVLSVFKQIYQNDFRHSVPQEDWKGIDGYIKDLKIQIKSGNLGKKEAEEIMEKGILLIEVQYGFRYGANRILCFNRNELALLHQKNAIKTIIDSYIRKNGNAFLNGAFVF